MNRVVSRISLLSSVLLVCVLAAFSAGCGAPTLESQISRYKTISDKLDLLATKQPQFKADIEKKKVEFAAELEVAKAKPGEEGGRAVADLNYRMEKFEAGLNPQPAANATNRPVGSKLGARRSPASPASLFSPASPSPAASSAAPRRRRRPATPAAAALARRPRRPPRRRRPRATAALVPRPRLLPPTPAPAPVPAPAPDGGSGFGGK